MHDNEKETVIRNRCAMHAFKVSRFLLLFGLPFELREMVTLTCIREKMPLDQQKVMDALMNPLNIGKFICKECSCPFSAQRLVRLSYL